MGLMDRHLTIVTAGVVFLAAAVPLVNAMGLAYDYLNYDPVETVGFPAVSTATSEPIVTVATVPNTIEGNDFELVPRDGPRLVFFPRV